MLSTLARRVTSQEPSSLLLRNASTYTGSFKPKKVWPPDFSKLSPTEQFRFERRYKRRVKLATARPRWDKYVKLAQLSSVTFVLIYSLLFMDWNTENQPLQGVRDKFWSAFGGFSPDQRHERRQIDAQQSTRESR